MPDDAWLTLVIAFTAAVAIVLMSLVARNVPSRRRSSRKQRDGAPVARPATGRRAWAVRSFGPWYHPHSVEDNLQRALDRIDQIDPYVMPRRIGATLSEAGLLTVEPAAPADPDPPGRRDPWLFGPTTTHAAPEKETRSE